MSNAHEAYQLCRLSEEPFAALEVLSSRVRTNQPRRARLLLLLPVPVVGKAPQVRR